MFSSNTWTLAASNAEVVGTGLLIFIVLCLVFLILFSIFLAIAAMLIGLPNRSFTKAIVGTLALGIGYILVNLAINSFNIINPWAAMAISLLIPGFMIKFVYGCALLHGVCAYVLSLIVAVVAMVGLSAALNVDWSQFVQRWTG